ncbi:MAG: chromate transporter [Bradyrhizobium sp.]|uniref:chromate transporter n=1 Tax=Bradyrhizobium sp. TaxID=376 RepID=UPI001C2A4207|nr:chromate transporter [Bradyrhizobium sp.]MBU6464564.1 chromate transporter [Pseudomonadota bacterium]MDE2069421.1 chromate transporter [Bradyrhizobium sp.]MDE2241834.1 chromate transporter [Bradyrhizobium sp.]MDE2469028.1 chromate transporter [Bradyrhizobium sp.]
MPPDSPAAAVPVPGSAPESPASPPPGLIALFVAFAKMSLAEFGGVMVFARRAIVEQHRWMTADEFNETFALCHFLPGPNVLIVTLIGYAVAGIGGALVATLSMCVPTAVLAFFVSRFLRRSSHSRWPAIVQAALVPLSIGLMGASGLILALAADRSWAAALVTAGAALLASSTRLNPLWLLAAGGFLGFAGLLG